MAVDHVTIQTPNGPVDVATDHDPVSLADAQLVKLAISADGSLVVIPADAANGLDVDVTRVQGVVHVDDNGGSVTVDGAVSVGNFPATQPVSAAALPLPAGAATDATVANIGAPADVEASGNGSIIALLKRLRTLLAGGLPAALSGNGALKVEQVVAGPTQPVSGTVSIANFPGSQPVSLATNTPDVIDRAARLLGHVTVDNASIATTGGLTDAQLRASAVPVSDARLPVALKTLPAGADGLAALPVYITSILLLSYDAAARNIASGALVANTAKQVLSIEHALTSTKTVKIRRIMVGGLQLAAVAGMVDIQITKGTAASSAGTAVTPNTRKGGDAAPEAVVKSLPTIVAATVGDTIPWGATAATANTPMPTLLVYDWQEGGETKPLQLRAGVLESIVINVISTAAQSLSMTVSIDFTEE